MHTKISNGLVIDPANNIEAKHDIYISEGRIAAIGKQPDGFTVDKTIDATGCHVIPGIVDLRARLREPGLENKGTIKSGSYHQIYQFFIVRQVYRYLSHKIKRERILFRPVYQRR